MKYNWKNQEVELANYFNNLIVIAKYIYRLIINFPKFKLLDSPKYDTSSRFIFCLN